MERQANEEKRKTGKVKEEYIKMKRCNKQKHSRWREGKKTVGVLVRERERERERETKNQ
jgi:hypothetical protein